MIYQFSGFLLPFIITVDLILIGLLILSTNPKSKQNQRLKYGLVIIAFLGFILFKVLFTGPHTLPSTPVDLKIETNSAFTTLYYIGDFKGELSAFWKEHIIGKSKEQHFDLESSVANGLIIANKFDGDWYSTTIEMNWDKVSILNLDRTNFEKADNEIKKAIKRYRWIEFANYLSNLLTLTFIVLIFRRIKNIGS